MRFDLRLAPAIVAVALASGTALGQSDDDNWLGRDKLGGSWRSPGGSVTLADHGWDSDRYDVSGTLQGKAVSNGASLVFTPDVSVGIAGAVQGQTAAAATPITFTYTSGDRFDWLSSPGLSLYRAHKAPSGLNGPWSKPEDQPPVNPERISGLYDNLRDLQGNDDRIANEGASNLTDAQKLAAAMAFLAQKEAAWGQPVTDLQASDFPSPALYDFFRAEKAVELARQDRTPDDVKDFFLNVSGSVEGQPINPRKIFAQLWKSSAGTASVIGAVIPGYRDTGRTFADQIQLANKAGADMVAMDAQWGGWTEGGHSGGVDSGQGIARDAYGFASWVHATFPQRKLFMMGSSLGGGPGTYGTLLLAAEGQAEVKVDDGKKVISGHDLLPPSTPAIIQAPFLAMHSDVGKDFKAVGKAITTFSFTALGDSNDITRFLGILPWVKTMEFQTSAQLSGDRASDVKNILVREDSSASQPEAMDATLAFGKDIVEKVHMGLGPRGPVYVIHAKDDTLADYKTSLGVVNDLRKQGRTVELTTLGSDHHTFWNETSEMGSFLPYLAKIQGK